MQCHCCVVTASALLSLPVPAVTHAAKTIQISVLAPCLVSKLLHPIDCPCQNRFSSPVYMAAVGSTNADADVRMRNVDIMIVTGLLLQ